MPAEFIRAAVEAAAESGRDVADVSVAEIARAAGVSRSTLLRRLGGTRAPLDMAVAATGIALGGRAPVRERAVEATGWLLDEQDLASVTMEAIADRAECSTDSLYAVSGSRDALLLATFERFSPLHAITEWLGQDHGGLRETVEGFYRVVVDGLVARPQVLPAFAAQVFARGGLSDPGVHTVVHSGSPRIFMMIGGWMTSEVAAGNIRELPLPLLLQTLGGPILFHAITRPMITAELHMLELPDVEQSITTLADNFLRAVATEAFWADEARSAGA